MELLSVCTHVRMMFCHTLIDIVDLPVYSRGCVRGLHMMREFLMSKQLLAIWKRHAEQGSWAAADALGTALVCYMIVVAR